MIKNHVHLPTRQDRRLAFGHATRTHCSKADIPIRVGIVRIFVPFSLLPTPYSLFPDPLFP
ncbi:hypothetical protein [Moorena sp. SIO4G3]|uniref:hypothetical protein n=1 Tax=Moorena sp. SIO4G3 TaxID=2607821 RepID=UPI0014297452|nr:hypothetical protein [Moorena sp. SIO4G3]NEO75923.1 hypothetical protein [Moorena sp. SIO4G3]